MEVILFPEMLAAGVEALSESKKRELDDANICVAIYLAMRAAEEIALAQGEEGTIH